MKSIKIPFTFDGGRVGSTSDSTTIAEQKIANVLVTNAGERVMAPNYGATTARLLFDISSPMEFTDYKTDALEDLRQSISRVDILDLRINNSFYSQTSEPTTAIINVLYRLPLGSPQAMEVDIAIPGQITEDSSLYSNTRI